MGEHTEAVLTLDELYKLKSGIGDGDALARLQALELCRKLQAELETPGETIIKTTWAEACALTCLPSHHWVLYAAQDLDVFTILAEDDNAPKTVAHIADKTKAEPFLIRRMLRQMATMHSIRETDVDTFTNNKFSRYLLTDSASSTLKFMRWFSRVEASAPEFLAHNDWTSPSDPKKAPFTWTYELGEISWFEYLSQNPTLGAQFAAMMRAESEGKPTWSDGQLYPVKEKLRSVEDPDGVLVVDLGGGNGHDLEWFRKNHPDLKGRLILQDLPYITDNVSLEGIESMAHDFYTEQPVKGSQVYFLHQIMHDYDDARCLQILRAIVPAMKPGYSKLLINDLVLPDKGAHWFTTTMDLQLMLAMCARERTSAQFLQLIGRVGGGLRVEKIWRPTVVGMLDSLVECVVD